MNTNTTINDLFPSRFIKSADIGDTDTVLTISKVAMEDLGYGDGQDTKPVVYFQEIDKGLVMNKTNAESIGQLYGERIDGWPGKKITLFTTEVSFQGKPMLGIRVRLRPPNVDEEKPSDDEPEPPSNWEE